MLKKITWLPYDLFNMVCGRPFWFVPHWTLDDWVCYVRPMCLSYGLIIESTEEPKGCLQSFSADRLTWLAKGLWCCKANRILAGGTAEEYVIKLDQLLRRRLYQDVGKLHTLVSEWAGRRRRAARFQHQTCDFSMEEHKVTTSGESSGTWFNCAHHAFTWFRTARETCRCTSAAAGHQWSPGSKILTLYQRPLVHHRCPLVFPYHVSDLHCMVHRPS